MTSPCPGRGAHRFQIPLRRHETTRRDFLRTCCLTSRRQDREEVRRKSHRVVTLWWNLGLSRCKPFRLVSRFSSPCVADTCLTSLLTSWPVSCGGNMESGSAQTKMHAAQTTNPNHQAPIHRGSFSSMPGSISHTNVLPVFLSKLYGFTYRQHVLLISCRGNSCSCFYVSGFAPFCK